MSTHKRTFFGIAYTCIIVVTLLVLGEFGLRLASRFFTAYRSSPFRRYDAELGVSLIPDITVSHNRGCFQGTLSINRWAMRDRDRQLDRTPGALRIAVLGDSILEGAHVAPDEVMNIQMEQLLNRSGVPNAEVLNFGIAGIGTTQQLLLYRERVRRFHPDLVVLLFSDNDVMNNSRSIQDAAYGIHTFYSPYYAIDSTGGLSLIPVESRRLNFVWSFFEQHSLLTYYIERLWMRVHLHPRGWHKIPIEWGVYGDPVDAEWSEAWEVTERVLRTLRDEVLEDHALFVVLRWPSLFDIDVDWAKRLQDEIGQIPSDFRPASLREHLGDVTRRNSIAFDSLDAYMREYRDANHLTWPYFSLSCDPHPSALGHRVGAQAIVDRLNQRGLIPQLRQASTQ